MNPADILKKLTQAQHKHRHHHPHHGFHQPSAKLTIVSLDEPTLKVEAQYNPTELSLTAAVSWEESKPVATRGKQWNSLEFKGRPPQTLQIELFFDTFETHHHGHWKSVQDQIDLLRTLIDVQDRLPSKGRSDARPHLCVVVWGAGGGTRMPRLCCVIDNLTTKYTMWSPDGTPLRATCTISVKECDKVGRDIVIGDRVGIDPAAK